MRVETTELAGVLLLTPDVHGDARGFFLETYHAARYAAAGIGCGFVQDNVSRSARGVLRGMHYQLCQPQDKLVMVLRGEILDVAVDVRRGSPTFGRATSRVLNDANHAQLFIPAGFAHGFCVLSDGADVHYKCSRPYAPGDEVGFRYDSPALAFAWPVAAPLLSARDAALPRFEQLPDDRLLVYGGPAA